MQELEIHHNIRTKSNQMQGKLTAFLILNFLTFKALAQGEFYRPETPIKCGSSQKCPEAWPCCSPYGQCGTGPICLGGCNPRFSYNETSCAPMPALVPPNNIEYFTGPLSYFDGDENEKQLKSRGFLHFNKYLISGDDEEVQFMLDNIDFTYSGPVKIEENSGDVVLQMPKRSSGCLLATTKSFLYGKSSVRLKTARSQGVITSVVVMSAAGDEIDLEFRGSELDKVQSNYYYRGELIYNKMKEITVSSDTWATYHDYGIDWTADRIHWTVDGEIVRTLEKEETWDENLKIYKYPETPMRLEVGLWPGGSENNHPGTIDWAGGLIDWENSPDMIENGQFSAAVRSMEVSPYSNRYIPAMQCCLEEEDCITYDYVKKPNEIFDETSLTLYCGLAPNLSGWSQTGSSISRDPFLLAKSFGKAQDREKEFVQNMNSTVTQNMNNTTTQNMNNTVTQATNVTTSYNATNHGPEPIKVETSGQSSLYQRNPLFQIKRFLISIF